MPLYRQMQASGLEERKGVDPQLGLAVVTCCLHLSSTPEMHLRFPVPVLACGCRRGRVWAEGRKEA